MLSPFRVKQSTNRLFLTKFNYVKKRFFRMVDTNEIRKGFRLFLSAYLSNLSVWFSNRKLLLFTALAFLLLLYIFPRWFGLGSRRPNLGVSYYCLEEQLRHYEMLEARQDAFIRRVDGASDGGDEKPFVPFVGNGFVGLAFSLVEKENAKSAVELRLAPPGRHTLSLTLGRQEDSFNPLLAVGVPEAEETSSAFVVQLVGGLVRKISCVVIKNECVTVTSTVYAHRKYPWAVVQEININNPHSTSVEVKFSTEHHKTLGSSWQTKKTASGQIYGKEIADGDKTWLFTAMHANTQSEMQVLEPKRSESWRHITVFHMSEQVDLTASVKTLEKLYNKVSGLSTTAMLAEHENIWKQLWSPIFGISLSLAPGVLNGDLINATRYAVLSNSRAPIHEDKDAVPTTTAVVDSLALLRRKDMCFNKPHNTLVYPSKLWSKLSTFDDIVEVAYKWRLTLMKSGCQHLVTAGADGVSEAMVLSFGAFKFSHHHLEFDVQPEELHRDFFFGGLSLDEEGAATKLNVWVEIGETNRPELFVAAQGQSVSRRWLACEAGCTSQPIRLSSARQKFAVKRTEPPTAILYITSDKEHMTELKHTIHVRAVSEALAVEQQVLALHRHGHRLAGLPTSFWALLVLLIVLFHLFLMKLVYNEWVRYDRSAGALATNTFVSRLASSRTRYAM